MAMKPVEVEILTKDRLSVALDKAGRKVDDLKGKATACLLYTSPSPRDS